jgi:hypothetical protein
MAWGEVMAEISIDAGVRRSAHTPFFLYLSCALTAFIFIGFGITYFQPMATGSLGPLSPIVHVHGAFYFAWMLLLVAQSALVNRRNLALHRSMGLFGIGIASGVVIFGVMITLMFARAMIEVEHVQSWELTYFSLCSMVVFASLFIAAIRNVRTPDAHRRYIILATVVLIPAGFNRIYSATLGLDFHYPLLYLSADLLIAILAIYDWRTLGRVHNATLIGGAVNLAPQLLHPLLGESAPFISLTEWLASLGHYSAAL